MQTFSSSKERAKKTLEIAYEVATGKETTHVQLYNNLLTDETVIKKKQGYSAYDEYDEKHKEIQTLHPDREKKHIQNKTSTMFLRGEFETDDPFTISLHRLRVLRLLLRNADKNKKIKPYTIIGFRHGNKESGLLSQEGEEQAEKLGRDILKKEIKAGGVKALYATHQLINESLLISLIAGRNSRPTPKDARDDMPGAWKKPFDETQHITRKIDYHTLSDGEKVPSIIVSTNEHTEIFTLKYIERAIKIVGYHITKKNNL